MEAYKTISLAIFVKLHTFVQNLKSKLVLKTDFIFVTFFMRKCKRAAIDNRRHQYTSKVLLKQSNANHLQLFLVLFFLLFFFPLGPDEVAVIDEIQMIKDQQRGWAWTRALLGLYAQEIHVCGEASTIDLVRELALATGEDVEVRLLTLPDLRP